MNPVYLEFFKAFSLLLMQSQNMTLQESRAASTQFFTHNVIKEPVYQIRDMNVIGIDHNQIPIRLFKPSSKDKLPILLFFHSGGWSFGSIDDADALCRQIANRAQCIVVAVDYRLAPENKFPKGLEDCYAATKWIYQNASSLGGDQKRIAVGGESAGANLAAAVTLMAKDRNEFKLKFQLLLYPVMTSDLNEKIYKESMDQYFITYDAMKMFWDFYLEKPEEGNNPYASPLKAANLSDLPPAFIVTAEYDSLREEGEAYAKRLLEAKVPTTYKRYANAVHSFLSLPIVELQEKREALKDIQKELTSGL